MSLYVDVEKQLGAFSLGIKFDTCGKWQGILGASGCGKSMTLKMISGIERPDRGRIVLNGNVLFDSEEGICLPPQKRNVGYLFQNYALFPNMTVMKNIECGLKKADPEHVAELLSMLELTGLENRYPDQLSGGQQQRTALARCLAGRPDAILLDEPFSALDEFLREKLQQDIKNVLRQYSGELLLVSHSRDEVFRFCDRITILDDGRSVADGKTSEVFGDPVHVTAARLSGCKNISPAERRGEYEVFAKDWGVALSTDRPISDKIKYIGIRAHDIVAVDESIDEKSNRIAAPKTNSISAVVAEVQDSMFETDVIFKCGTGRLWWKTAKDDRSRMYTENAQQKLVLPPDRLMLLES